MGPVVKPMKVRVNGPGGADGDGLDFREGVEEGPPGQAAVDGLPGAAAGGADVDDVRVRGSTAVALMRPVTFSLPGVCPSAMGAGPTWNQPVGTLGTAPAPVPWRMERLAGDGEGPGQLQGGAVGDHRPARAGRRFRARLIVPGAVVMGRGHERLVEALEGAVERDREDAGPRWTSPKPRRRPVVPPMEVEAVERGLDRPRYRSRPHR